LEREAAERYERLLVGPVTSVWARDLVERIGLKPGARVLDVACGTGVVARRAASKVGPSGRVAALDVNRGMLAVARSMPSPQPIEWHEGNAGALPFGDEEFDVVLCQLGLQFFPRPEGALREMHRVLASAGHAGASVYTAIDRNPAADALADAVDRHLGEGTSEAKRSEHSLADPDELRRLFDEAGFASAESATVTQTVRFASVEEWVEIQFAATPLAALVADLDSTQRDQIVGRVSAAVGEALARFTSADSFSFPQEAHVVIADT